MTFVAHNHHSSTSKINAYGSRFFCGYSGFVPDNFTYAIQNNATDTTAIALGNKAKCLNTSESTLKFMHEYIATWRHMQSTCNLRIFTNYIISLIYVNDMYYYMLNDCLFC